MLRAAVTSCPPPVERTIRVASVPASHVYVRHLDASGSVPDVLRLADPRPDGGTAAQSAWWPPVMLDPDWIDAHADDFDVMHVHFGFDAITPQLLSRVVARLRAHAKPLVFTVHDLRNPHHLDRRAHDEQLDVLVPAADQLVTLTDGAAAEILRRWGRAASVLPHPHVVELETAARIRSDRQRRGGPFRIGVHLKSLRACMDAPAVLPVLAQAARDVGGVLQVNAHRDVMEPGSDRFDPVVHDVVAGLGSVVDLRVHDFFSDADLWDYLGSLDVSALPYRFGTHSGWVEACRDVGTSVVAPTCGHYADQGPVHSYVMDESTFDASSLGAAVREAHDSPHPRVDLSARLEQRDAVAEAHHAIYERLVRS